MDDSPKLRESRMMLKVRIQDLRITLINGRNSGKKLNKGKYKLKFDIRFFWKKDLGITFDHKLKTG